MIPAIVVTLCLLFYFLGFKFYSRYLADKVFGLRGKEFVTPAHTHNDGIDYVPTKPSVLFGHHFASIAGLAPILGPAVACDTIPDAGFCKSLMEFLLHVSGLGAFPATR